MSETFADLFEQSLENIDLKVGSTCKGQVIKIIPNKFVVLSTGLKSESYIPYEEFLGLNGELTVKVGDAVDVVLESVENGHGETRLSREKASRLETWQKLEEYCENGTKVNGVIVQNIEKGYIVEIGKIRAFLPASLLGIKQPKDNASLRGKELELKIVSIDKKTNKIVVSHRDVLEEISGVERASLVKNMKEGSDVVGTVKNITDYGVFVDLGGVDGLLHITDMSWKRVRHPSELVKLGEEIKVKILKIDREKGRVSLGLKQLSEDPWQDINLRYPVGKKITGHVSNIADYGCFVEIEPGIEGLVHMSEMDWTNKNVNPAKFVSLGQEVDVVILEVDADRRRISLGMKQCHPNPWLEFANSHKKDDKITAKVKSITDFGLFLGLEGEIDGLVHMSDLSWTEPGEKIIRNYKKGDEVEAVILAIDPERERISLGIKQLQTDIYSDYLTKNPKGSVVKGKVVEVEPKQALVDLGDGIVGKVRAADVSRETVKDATQLLAIDDEIEAKVLGFDKKSRHINLSIKELQPELGAAEENTVKFGDILKEQIGDSAE